MGTMKFVKIFSLESIMLHVPYGVHFSAILIKTQLCDLYAKMVQLDSTNSDAL